MQDIKLYKIDYITSDICSIMQLFFSLEEFDIETNKLLVKDLLLQQTENIQSEEEEYKIASGNKYLDYLLPEMINNGSKYLKNVSYDYYQKCLERKQNLNIQAHDGTLLTYFYFKTKKEKIFKFPINKTQLLKIINDTNEEINNNFQNENKSILSDYITKKLLEQVNSYVKKLFDVDTMAKFIFDMYSYYYSMTVLPDKEKIPIHAFLNSFFTKIINRDRTIREQEYRAYHAIGNDIFLKTMTEAETNMEYKIIEEDLEQCENTFKDIFNLNKEKTITGQSKETKEKISRKITEEISKIISEEIGKEISKEIKEKINKKIYEEIGKEISKKTREEISRKITEEISKIISEKMGKKITEEISEIISEIISKIIGKNPNEEPLPNPFFLNI